MKKSINITSENIIHQIKLSGKISEIIEEIITLKIVTNTVAEVGIKVETEELQQAADEFRFINRLQNTHDTWVWLKNQHLSLDDFEELIYTNLISSKLAQHLFADKVDSYFFEHQLDYASVVMYEVVLEDEDLALELFYAVKEGEISFYDVADKYIQEPELRRKGGYQGKVNRADLKPEISTAVFAAIPPQILKPIATSKGIHLIKVEELIQPQLDNLLRYKILSDLFSDWLKRQVEQFSVELDWEQRGWGDGGMGR